MGGCAPQLVGCLHPARLPFLTRPLPSPRPLQEATGREVSFALTPGSLVQPHTMQILAVLKTDVGLRVLRPRTASTVSSQAQGCLWLTWLV